MSKVKSAFQGGVPARGITKAHRPLVWENMLGTVMAYELGTYKEKYFDYDYDAAYKFAGVAQCTDLRVCKNPRPTYQTGPRHGRVVLFGIPPSHTLSS